METINNRAVEASVRFLTSKGYEILDRSWTAAGGQAIDIIAKDDDGIAFVNVSANVGTQRFEDPTITREQRESAAAQPLYLLRPGIGKPHCLQHLFAPLLGIDQAYGHRLGHKVVERAHVREYPRALDERTDPFDGRALIGNVTAEYLDAA